MTAPTLGRRAAESAGVDRRTLSGSSMLLRFYSANSHIFFSAVPLGGDLYLLKSILHDWDDADCARILRNCRQAMTREARLLVVERVVPPPNTPSEATLFDINMLVVTGGQERREEEYAALFRAAGFELARTLPTRSPLGLIEGRPVG